MYLFNVQISDYFLQALSILSHPFKSSFQSEKNRHESLTLKCVPQDNEIFLFLKGSQNA